MIGSRPPANGSAGDRDRTRSSNLPRPLESGRWQLIKCHFQDLGRQRRTNACILRSVRPRSTLRTHFIRLGPEGQEGSAEFRVTNAHSPILNISKLIKQKFPVRGKTSWRQDVREQLQRDLGCREEFALAGCPSLQRPTGHGTRKQCSSRRWPVRQRQTQNLMDCGISRQPVQCLAS